MSTSALFVDRDGVINRMVKYKTGWDSPQTAEDVVLVPGIVEIIKWANSKYIPVIQISNQPGVAKGKLSQYLSLKIQQKVEKLLKLEGANLDNVYICPHHPRGVIPNLTKECDCRKPRPGLLLKAAREMKINLDQSIFLGDNETDAIAGRAAGCKTVLFTHDEDEPEKVSLAKSSTVPDYKIETLFDFLRLILGEDHF